MWLGIDPVKAGEFSFLLSIPAIAGAAVLELPKLGSALHEVGPAPLVVGFAVSLVSGVFAIRWLITLLRRRAFHWFAPYCWVIGILAIVWAWRA
jgi:undecaprenyl-diphosphatase